MSVWLWGGGGLFFHHTVWQVKNFDLSYFYFLLKCVGYDDVIIMNNFTIMIIVLVFVLMIITSVLLFYFVHMKISIVKIFLFINFLWVCFFPFPSFYLSYSPFPHVVIFLFFPTLRVCPFSLYLSFIYLSLSVSFLFSFVF